MLSIIRLKEAPAGAASGCSAIHHEIDCYKINSYQRSLYKRYSLISFKNPHNAVRPSRLCANAVLSGARDRCAAGMPALSKRSPQDAQQARP